MNAEGDRTLGIPNAVEAEDGVHSLLRPHVYLFESVLFLIAGRRQCEN